jgi:pSer/pThr/pTyr-binding forkhead associated (FHA) protein
VPKAKPYPESEEEEKTTIESQWEEEASTTVEQGDVADKIRSLNAAADARRGNTGHTNTGAVVDEPTVDDKQMSALTPVRDVARLQITQGNDAGTEVEIRPGKTYTIGRAIDNDVVLTDIAVSRKHFDLRFEDAAWVIVDRGSGNGTVVNGNLEDNPFMLANGDTIEIGNTVFRFDQPNAASRPQRTMDIDADDEELSTVAGKPLRDVIEPLAPIAPLSLRQPPTRPKTLPPPAPIRSVAASQPPPLGFPPPTSPSISQTVPPLPASTLPMAQMANRPPPATLVPAYGPGSPTILGDPVTGLPGLPPTTLAGQGAPSQRPYAYPTAAEIPPHSVHAQMLLIQTGNRRGDASTAHVSPMSFDAMPPPRYTQPQLTKKAKMVLLAIGIAVFVAVMTVAIVKSSTSKKTALAATPTDKKETKKAAPKPAAVAEQPKTITTPAPPPKTIATPAPAPANVATPAPVTATAPRGGVSPQPTGVTQPKPTAQTPTPAPTAVATAPKPPTQPLPTAAPAPPPPTVKQPEAARTEPVRTTVRDKKDRPKQKNTRREPKREPQAREPQIAAAPTPPPSAGKKTDPDAAKAAADKLYRDKKFNDASNYLANQAKKFDEDIARDMRRTADMYAKLGRALAQGTAQATNAADRFEALRSAQNYDRNVGDFFDGEIQGKLAQVAPNASLLYISRKKYASARSALLIARQFNASSDTVRLATNKLESVASDLYNEALAMQATDSAGAKDRYKLILQIVDSTSTWYKKAQSKLGS